MTSSFLSGASAYLHQGLSSSSQNVVAGQTAVEADVAAIKMFCLAHPCANATVGCVRTKPEMIMTSRMMMIVSESETGDILLSL